MIALCLAGAATVMAATGCGLARKSALSAAQPAQFPDEIMVCGKRHHVGVPVVLWSDPGGLNAYIPGPTPGAEGPPGLRYEPGRSWADLQAAITAGDLAEHVDLLVIHYDASGFSRRCYTLLQNKSILSAHFMIDVDGTVYQTLDLRDQAWHGRYVNPRSIGIEMAQIGVYLPDDLAADVWHKRDWYVREGDRQRLSIPAELGDPHIRLPGPFYSARNEPVRGPIHGKTWEQVDFTPQQYATLVRLTAELTRHFPRIAVQAPRTADGTVRTDQLARTEMDAFRGIVGHYHITTERNDPGPAFAWDHYLQKVRAARTTLD